MYIPLAVVVVVSETFFRSKEGLIQLLDYTGRITLLFS